MQRLTKQEIMISWMAARRADNVVSLNKYSEPHTIPDRSMMSVTVVSVICIIALTVLAIGVYLMQGAVTHTVINP